jgi:hypothetical protein
MQAAASTLDAPRETCIRAGAHEALTSLATRAAEGVSLEDPQGAAQLLEELHAAGAGDALRCWPATPAPGCPSARISSGASPGC